jgi:F0F1-type ATP synthase gamma subunit
LHHTGRPLAQRHDQSGDLPTLADVEAIAARFADWFTSGQTDSVHVAYTNFVSAGVHRPELLTLLPMAALTGGWPPTPPGKTGGAVMYVQPIDMSIEQAMRFAVTAGMSEVKGG